MAAEVLNKRSDLIQASGIPTVPLASQMKYGELALNYANGAETLFIKNSNNDIVSFSNDNALIGYVDNSLSNYYTKGLSGNAKIFAGTCSTAAATVAKVVDCNLFTSADLVKGALIFVTFSATNSGAVASLTMNVNSTGAKPLKKIYTATTPANLVAAGELRADQTYLFSYDGTNWVCITLDYNTNSTYSAMTQAEITAGTSTTGRTMTPKLLRSNFYTEGEVDNLLNGKQNVPLVIEIDSDDETVPNGTFQDIHEALGVGREVIVEFTNSAGDDETYYSDSIVDLVSSDDYYYFLVKRPQGVTIIYIQHDDSISMAYNSYASDDHVHGNIRTSGELLPTDVTITNGDKLVITDYSNGNKIARSSTTFDGSTTTKALTQKGTFETFVTFSDLELSQNYEMPDLNEISLSPGDSYEESFGKLEKAILNNELVTSYALTDLNSSIEELINENNILKQNIIDNELVTASALNDLSNNVELLYNLTESKQDSLVSGTSIKTINSESLLGSGNINIPIVSVTLESNSGTSLINIDLTGKKIVYSSDNGLTNDEKFYVAPSWTALNARIGEMTGGAGGYLFSRIGSCNIAIYYPSGTDSILLMDNYLLAPKNSPTFTGTPTAPTAATGTNTTQLATTEFVQNNLSEVKANVIQETLDLNGLPYDAQVEYLLSDGTAYINTLINGSSNISVKANITILSNIDATTSIFGARVSTTSKNNCLLYYKSTGFKWRWDGTGRDIPGTNVTGDYTIDNTADPKTMTVTGAANGSISGTETFTTDLPMAIFTLNTNGTFGDSTTYLMVKCFKMFNSGVLVRDYIPVRKNGVGYLYDKVSGQLFGNAAASGAFTYGNDVEKPYDAEVEYLLSDGTAYIDTGYMPNSNTTVEARYKTTKDISPFSVRWTGESTYDTFGVFISNATSKTIVYYGRYSSNEYIQISISLSDITNMIIGLDKLVVNDSEYNISRSDFTSTYPMFIFAVNSQGSATNIGSTIYSFLIKENGVVVHDYIPVRKSGIGYLYDKVSGTLFGNAADSGEFTYGNDIISSNIKQIKVDKNVYSIDADLLNGQYGDYYAPIDSPTFIGIPTAPTAESGTNTTLIATTEFVSNSINKINGCTIYTDLEFTKRVIGDGVADVSSGVAKINKIKGNTLVWNLLVAAGDFSGTLSDNWSNLNSSSNTTSVSSGILTINSTSVGYQGGLLLNIGTIITGHKYYLGGYIWGDAADSYNRTGGVFMCNASNSIDASTHGQSDSILNSSSTTKLKCSLIFTGNASYKYLVLKPRVVNSNTYFSNIMLIDLTEMFGSGNEPTISEFEKLYPLDYYNRDTGSLLNFTASELRCIKYDLIYNLLVPVPTNVISTSTEYSGGYALSQSIPSGHKVYIRCEFMKSVDYTTSYNGLNDILLANQGNTNGGRISFLNIPADGLYHTISGIVTSNNTNWNLAILTYKRTSGSVSMKNGMVVNLTKMFGSGNEPTKAQFEELLLNVNYPFNKTQFDANNIAGSAKINVTTVTGKVNGESDSVIIFPDGMLSSGTVYDEIYNDNGVWKAIKRINSIDLGTLTWTYSDSTFVSLVINGTAFVQTYAGISNFECGKYIKGSKEDLDNNIATICCRTNQIYIKDSNYSDADTFKTAMSGVKLNYELYSYVTYVLDSSLLTLYNTFENGYEVIIPENTSTVTTSPAIFNILYGINISELIKELNLQLSNLLNSSYILNELDKKVSKSGDTMTGSLHFSAGCPVMDFAADTSNMISGMMWVNLAKNVVGGIYMHNTAQRIFINSCRNDFSSNIWSNLAGQYSFVVGKNELLYDAKKVWYEGNDGTGSGLDADLLDGYHAKDVYRASAGAFSAGSNSTGWGKIIEGEKSTSGTVDCTITILFTAYNTIANGASAILVLNYRASYNDTDPPDNFKGYWILHNDDSSGINNISNNVKITTVYENNKRYIRIYVYSGGWIGIGAKILNSHSWDRVTNSFTWTTYSGCPGNVPKFTTIPGTERLLTITEKDILNNCATSSKLLTPRTLTIGDTGKQFDGSADVSWTGAEIGIPQYVICTLNSYNAMASHDPDIYYIILPNDLTV